MVKINKTNEKIKIDQSQIENVLPRKFVTVVLVNQALNKVGLVVKGKHKNKKCVILSVNQESYELNVRIITEKETGNVDEKLDFSSVCKAKTI